ncbi:hypothetical protein [Oligoflexus sp.]|uniref:hypothetical protein n=1 Tax=Oligoflexus sp. TaxID=1971216 RepID=UPI002D7733B4|nr:hypothetical protein [Oligoflexus sp.]
MKPSQEREDYQECVTSVIRKYQSPGNVKKNKKLQNGLAACKDRYPAVSIMIDCKKEMAAAYRDDHEALKAALIECKNEYSKYTFNPKNPVPFVLRGDQLFFAGAGMNRSHPIRAQEDEDPNAGLFMGDNFGNFSCTTLYKTMFREQQPEYLLFGNDPFVYTPLRHAKREEFLKAVGLAAALNKPKTMLLSMHRDFGELHYEPSTQETINYFPMGFCNFDRKLGPVFEGMKIYYLVDRVSTQVTPYFGTAFYRDDSRIAAKDLIEQIRAQLGDQYRTFTTRPGVTLISQVEPKIFDKEGDPRNVCQNDQISPYMAVVTEREQTGMAAYTLLANISNLCRYGDKISSRFLKKGP